jgi:hypothetical protein
VRYRRWIQRPGALERRQGGGGDAVDRLEVRVAQLARLRLAASICSAAIRGASPISAFRTLTLAMLTVPRAFRTGTSAAGFSCPASG